MMTTRIEILSTDATTATAAMYFDIELASRTSKAVDNARRPTGTSLSAAERQELVNGNIHEMVVTISIVGLSPDQVRTAFENKWRKTQRAAKDDYLARYSYVGDVYDSTGNWS